MHFITGSLLHAGKRESDSKFDLFGFEEKISHIHNFFLFFCRLAKNCMICHPTVLHPPQQPKRKLLEHSYSDV